MRNLEITAEIARRIVAAADSRGVSVEEYLKNVIENNQSGSEEPSYAAANADEWIKAFRDWAESHDKSVPMLSDEAISRESIYEDM
jgi:hypothetical protein